MLATIVITFLAIQGLIFLLLIGSCIVAARNDRKAVRPYVPQPVAYRHADFPVGSMQQAV